MKILVTGGTGFVGKNLIWSLLSDHEVHTTGGKNENMLPVGISGIHSRDLTSIDEKFDVVFHQAANNDTRDNDVYRMNKANVYDPIVMFHKLYGKGCRKFVYASSTAVYGNQPAPYSDKSVASPLNPYGQSKLDFDRFAMDFSQKKDISIIGLRYCNVYGNPEGHKNTRMSMIGQIIRKVFKEKEINLFKDGKQLRDWLYVEDAVDANLLAMQSLNSGIYNIGSGKAYTFQEIVLVVEHLLQKKAIINWVDCPFADVYQNHTECDIKKARTDFGFNPRFDLESGIKDYVENDSWAFD